MAKKAYALIPGAARGNRAKTSVGINCTPEGAFCIAIVLIATTLGLHFFSRLFK